MCVVSAIWMEEMGGAWSLQPPAGYANEQALHDIVMSTPQLLPLSGTPDITVIGREVPLPASGFADVLAVEPDGRPVIIEVKLRNNAESRRAVIAQALSYAASLHGLSRRDFEEGVLARHLEGQSLFDVVRGTLQDEGLIQSDFDTSLEEHLAAGSFRVVIVLDEAPPELINLVGYLEAVTTGLSLDLIAVTSYAIGGHRIAVPRRLDPEHRPEPAPPRPSKKANTGHTEPGIQPFQRPHPRCTGAVPGHARSYGRPSRGTRQCLASYQGRDVLESTRRCQSPPPLPKRQRGPRHLVEGDQRETVHVALADRLRKTRTGLHRTDRATHQPAHGTRTRRPPCESRTTYVGRRGLSISDLLTHSLTRAQRASTLTSPFGWQAWESHRSPLATVPSAAMSIALSPASEALAKAIVSLRRRAWTDFKAIRAKWALRKCSARTGSPPASSRNLLIKRRPSLSSTGRTILRLRPRLMRRDPHPQPALNGVQWTKADALTVLNEISSKLVTRIAGKSKTFAPLDLRMEPEIARLLHVATSRS
jgi:hypothetical protein